MQFIETSSLGVRAVVYHLHRDRDSPEFVLFPMVHIGSIGYYETVQRNLAQCDRILLEGISSRSALVLTLSYRIVGKVRSLDLVTQDHLDIGSLGLKVVHADMDRGDFDRAWRQLPLTLRVLLYAVVPFCALYMVFFGSKEFIAKHMELSDLSSREEVLYADENSRRLDDLILSQRDAHLIQQIQEAQKLTGAEGTSPKVVGVVYGASHMRAAMHFLLHDLGYHVKGAEWLTVFRF